MEHRKLLGTELKISPLCLGTMTFGSQAGLSEARRMVDMCIGEGVNFFDTANVYNQGRSEEILSQALGKRRPQVFLASKVRGVMGDPPQYGGLSRKAIRQAIDATLSRLATDYVDIYYLHQPDYEVPIEETLEAMEEIRKEGKIRYSGVSNYSAWQICEIHCICRRNNYQPPLISQPMYNLLARGIEAEYLPFTRRFQVSNVCYNPLAGGLLTGKQRMEQGPLRGTRFDGNAMYMKRYWHSRCFAAVENLSKIAADAGISLLQLAIRWLLQREGVDAVILGASRLTQLEENLQAANGPPLPPEVFESCDRVWEGLRGAAPLYHR